MDIDVESRMKRLKRLSEFASDARKKIFDVVKALQWDIGSLEEKREMACCPFDGGHIVPKTSLETHIERCKWNKQCYHPDDKPFPPLAVDTGSSSVLKVDKELQASILRQAKAKNPSMLIGFPGEVDNRDVPMSSDRFMSSLTSDERAAIHSYVILNTVSPCEGKDISLLEQDLEKNFQSKKEEKRDKTPLERLIEERDAKRRKEGKKVHINRKSHTEIIREVIENQMEVYGEWLKDSNMIKREDVEPVQVTSMPDDGSEAEYGELEVKQEPETETFSDHNKSFESDERKQRSWNHGERLKSYQRRERDEYTESWRRSDPLKSRDSRSEYRHSRDSGSKKYWENGSTSYRDSESTSYRDNEITSYRDNESTLYKDNEGRSYRDNGGTSYKDHGSTSHRDRGSGSHRSNERKNYKDHGYKNFTGKYKDSEKSDYSRVKSTKHGSEGYWDGGAHVVKKDASSDEEVERESKRKKRYWEPTDGEKHGDTAKRHHKSRRRHDSGDSGTESRKRHKKDKGHRRND